MAPPTLSPKPRRSGYLPTLDGWRALAILIVMVGHSPTIGFGRFTTTRFHFLGDFGVEVFFAISGLLICSRLLDEEERTGSLHLKGFYIRRLLRIQPPAIVFLAVVALLTVFHRIPANWPFFIASLLLFRNYVGIPSDPSGWPTVHYWSLSVEEHFYLLLPAFLLIVKRRRARILMGLVVVDLLWSYYNLTYPLHGDFFVRIRTDICVHFLLLAAVLAILVRRPRIRTWCSRYLHVWWVVPLAICVLPFKSPIHGLGFLTPSLLVLSTLLHPGALLGRLLEWAPLRYIGHISYSLYLWQEIFLSGYFAPELHTFGNMERTWLWWPCTLAAAMASYYLVERPCMRLGHKLAKPAVEGRPL